MQCRRISLFHPRQVRLNISERLSNRLRRHRPHERIPISAQVQRSPRAYCPTDIFINVVHIRVFQQIHAVADARLLRDEERLYRRLGVVLNYAHRVLDVLEQIVPKARMVLQRKRVARGRLAPDALLQAIDSAVQQHKLSRAGVAGAQELVAHVVDCVFFDAVDDRPVAARRLGPEAREALAPVDDELVWGRVACYCVASIACPACEEVQP
jgi:hypothetical protein